VWSNASWISKSASSTIIRPVTTRIILLLLRRIDFVWCLVVFYFETLFFAILVLFVKLYKSEFIYSVYPCPDETLKGSNFICWFFSYSALPFVHLRQKGGVFFDLGRDCIFKQVK